MGEGRGKRVGKRYGGPSRPENDPNSQYCTQMEGFQAEETERTAAMVAVEQRAVRVAYRINYSSCSFQRKANMDLALKCFF